MPPTQSHIAPKKRHINAFYLLRKAVDNLYKTQEIVEKKRAKVNDVRELVRMIRADIMKMVGEEERIHFRHMLEQGFSPT